MIITRGPPARPSWTPKGSTGPLLGTTALETHVGIEIVQTQVINLLTFIDPLNC